MEGFTAVVAEIVFVIGGVIAGVKKAWALCAVAAGLALVYAHDVIKGL